MKAGGRNGAAAAQAGGVQAAQTAPAVPLAPLAPAALSPRLQEDTAHRAGEEPELSQETPPDSEEQEQEEQEQVEEATARGHSRSSKSRLPIVCQVAGCGLRIRMGDADVKNSNLRYRICPQHMQADTLVAADGHSVQRWCHKCSRVHDLSAFDPGRRTCSKVLRKLVSRRRTAAEERRVAMMEWARDSTAPIPPPSAPASFGIGADLLAAAAAAESGPQCVAGPPGSAAQLQPLVAEILARILAAQSPLVQPAQQFMPPPPAVPAGAAQLVPPWTSLLLPLMPLLEQAAQQRAAAEQQLQAAVSVQQWVAAALSAAAGGGPMPPPPQGLPN